jgi:DNA-binding Lrp family transcriptional regulator
MEGKASLETKQSIINGVNGPRKLTFAELASMLHALLFAYEKVFMNLYRDEAHELYPYFIEELSHVLQNGEDPIIDPEKTLEENMDRVLFFISNEEYLKEVSLEKLSEGRYEFKVGKCTFAKSGVHDILKIKEGICPFALIMTACLTELTSNGYAKISKCEFDDDGSKAIIETHSIEDLGGRDVNGEASVYVKTQLPKIDEELMYGPTSGPELDELDLRIIRELRRDGRQSNVEIAKLLGSTESTIRRRISSLTERGIIRGFTIILRQIPGEAHLRVFLGLKANPKFINEISEKLAGLKETCSVYKSIGRHNLTCELLFSDRIKFQEFIDDLQYTEGVEEVDYSIASSAAKPCPWFGF